jgi:hypothetical protein
MGRAIRCSAGGGEVMTVSWRWRCANAAIQTALRGLVGRGRVKVLGQMRSGFEPAVHPQVLALALERVGDVMDRIMEGGGRIYVGHEGHGAPIGAWLTRHAPLGQVSGSVS